MSRCDAGNTLRAARVAREARDFLSRSASSSRACFQIGVQVVFGPIRAGRGEKRTGIADHALHALPALDNGNQNKCRWEHNMNSLSTFRGRLAQVRFDHRFARDFAADAIADPALPDPASWGELAVYLRESGACRAATVGAMIAWRSLRASKTPDP